MKDEILRTLKVGSLHPSAFISASPAFIRFRLHPFPSRASLS